LVEAEFAGWFASKLRKFLFLPLLERAMVAHVCLTDLVRGIVVDFCSLPSVVCSGGKPQILGDRVMEALFVSFSFWRASPRSRS
jgi:hypothetical protein